MIATKRNWKIFIRNWRSHLLYLLAATIVTLAIIGMAASLELYASLQLALADKQHDLTQALVLLNGSFEVNNVAMHLTENNTKLIGEQ